MPVARKNRSSLAAGLSLIAAACSDPGSPSSRLVERQSTPFYYYFDERIYLSVDARRLTVETTSPMAETAIARLREIAVEVDSATRAPWRDHWVLWLRGASVSLAVRASALLRMDPRFPFASNAYVVTGLQAPILLGNLFVVKLRSGASTGRLLRMNENLGVKWLGETIYNKDMWDLRFPAQSAFTPLEIAAAYSRHPDAEWASPDMLSELAGNLR